MAAVSRTTTATEATPRFALLGSTTFTNVEAGVLASTSNAAAQDKYGGVIFRWTDSSNYAQAELHLTRAADTLLIRTVVGGSSVTLNSTADPGLVADTFYRIKVVCLATGAVVAQVLDSTESRVLAEVEASSSLLAAGGTLASGKAGFSDQSTGSTAATRTYDAWYASVPTVDATVFASKQAEIRHDAYLRQDSAGVVWASKTVEGSYLTLPPAGREGRSAELTIRNSRGNPDTMVDTGIGSLAGTVYARPGYLNVPG